MQLYSCITLLPFENIYVTLQIFFFYTHLTENPINYLQRVVAIKVKHIDQIQIQITVHDAKIGNKKIRARD